MVDSKNTQITTRIRRLGADTYQLARDVAVLIGQDVRDHARAARQSLWLIGIIILLLCIGVAVIGRIYALVQQMSQEVDRVNAEAAVAAARERESEELIRATAKMVAQCTTLMMNAKTDLKELRTIIQSVEALIVETKDYVTGMNESI